MNIIHYSLMLLCYDLCHYYYLYPYNMHLFY